MQNALKLKIEDGFAFIEFDQPDSKVNVLSTANLEELAEIIAELKDVSDLKGVCILSKKPDVFIAGADIKEIEKIDKVAEARQRVEAGQNILNELEALPIPTLALLNGVCLGGGLELALACDWRLANFGDKVRLGLPEVKLGLIPGFGGTKRLPRLVGLRKGLEMIISGEPVQAEVALRLGLVDGLVSHERLVEEGITFLKEKGQKRKQFKPKLRGVVSILLEKTSLGRAILKSQAKQFILKTTKGHYPAPLVALSVTVGNYHRSLKEAFKKEAQAFAELVVGSICKNLISVFYLLERYKKAKWTESPACQIHKCGILGAGVMGGGIAQLISSFDILVRMKDLNYEALGRGLRQARSVYDYGVKKKRLRPNQALFKFGLISYTTTYAGFSNADLIIEAVIEDMRIKKALLKEVEEIAAPYAILASNTSCLSITEMAEVVKNKARVVGMHFFNPVQRMPLVEVIATDETSEETIATIVEFSKKIGKTPIVVKDSCGFLINRILLPYLNEAGLLLEEGISLERLDKLCFNFGMPMGPFTLMDEIGLDVGYKVALILEEHFGARMKVAGVLKKIYEHKWLGKKVGKGFYVYKGKEKQPNKKIYEFLSGRSGSLSNEDILKRMLYRMVNEAALCLEQKICSEPQDVDIGLLLGIGFPAFRAGLLHYADTLGCENIVADLERFRISLNAERFAPCDYLMHLAKAKKGFYG